MRASVAFFAGAGTVIAAIAAGLGGGLLMANVIGPNVQKHEMTRLEQRMSSKPVPVSSEPGHQQAPVPYVAATGAASAPASAAADPPQHSANPPPQTNQASHAVKDAGPARAATPNGPSQTSADTRSAETSTSNRENQASTQPATQEQQPSAPENANAMARDSDVRRAGDKKRTDRRQQARRQHGRDQQGDQNQRDADNRGWNDDNGWNSDNRGWKSGDRGWRDDRRWNDDSREIIVQRDYPDRPQRFGGPMRMGFPHLNLFGPD